MFLFYFNENLWSKVVKKNPKNLNGEDIRRGILFGPFNLNQPV